MTLIYPLISIVETDNCTVVGVKHAKMYISLALTALSLHSYTDTLWSTLGVTHQPRVGESAYF